MHQQLCVHHFLQIKNIITAAVVVALLSFFERKWQENDNKLESGI
jgi:hypothetical protein